jgi:outer membrane protein OmpA-like peptidoglycan-associated protein
MRLIRTFALLALGGSIAALAGCGLGPPGNPYYAPTPVQAGPVIPAYVTDDAIGDRAVRTRRARAAGSRPLPAAEVMDYVGRQELEFRRQTAGTGVDVIRAGEVLLLRLPASLTFGVGSAEISPQASSTLNEIALTLKSFNRSLVDVLGHTDSTGTESANKALSERRATTVSGRLRARGVAPARIATRGYGATYPIADNATEQGRALNRRVEIRVMPLR